MGRAIVKRRNTRGRRAFTLVELLVVIAVLGLLTALLVPVLGKAQQAARATKCRNNLSQIYKAARIYTNDYADLLPNLFAGLPFADHVKRYRESDAARSTDTAGEKVAAGLWLLKTGAYADAEDLLFCPNIPGRRQYGGSENPTEDGLPEKAGYVYNYFPDTSPGALPLLALPDGMTIEEVSNNINQPRHARFTALLADPFLHSGEMTHKSRNGLNCGYMGGSVQWVSMETLAVPWNAQDGEAEVFSSDQAGSLAVRDTWVALSERKR